MRPEDGGDATGGADASTSGTLSILSGLRLLDARHDHTCTHFSDGTARCWGPNNHGQLGDGTNTGEPCGILEVCKPTPVEVKGLRDVVSIGAGKHHSCAGDGDSVLWCWGSAANGVLGEMALGVRAPARVAGIEGVRQVTVEIGRASCRERV